MSQPKIRLATASPASGPTPAATLAQLARLARRAADMRADLLLLPEAYIGGYPRGTSFGCVIGSRSAAGRDEFLRYFNSAVDLGDTVGDGAGAGEAWVRRELAGGAAAGGDAAGGGAPTRGDGTREELERVARDTGVFLVAGCIEKAGGSLYCAVVYVCPKLGMIGKRRKVMPTGSERLVWAQGSPATLKAVSTTIRGVRINLAAAICWENYMPLVRQALYSQNINLYLAPTADGRDAWLALMRTVALEGRCFVVSSNMCVRSRGDESAVNGAGRDDAGTADPQGVEVALPHKQPPQRRRRQSVFDEDGNEIVLCGTSTGSERPVPDESAPSGTGAQPKSQAPSSATHMETTKIDSRGGSSIVSPFGDVLAGPQWEDDEGIIFADVDFADCIRGRLDLDAAGSYSRNDSFKLSVRGLDMDPLPY